MFDISQKSTRVHAIAKAVNLLFAAAGVWIMLESTFWGLQISRYYSGRLSNLGLLEGEAIWVAKIGPALALLLIGAILLSVGLWRFLEPPGKD